MNGTDLAADRTKRVYEGLSAIRAALPESMDEQFVEIIHLMKRVNRGSYVVAGQSLSGSDLLDSILENWIEIETE